MHGNTFYSFLNDNIPTKNKAKDKSKIDNILIMARQIAHDIINWKKEEKVITNFREIVTGSNSVNRLTLVLKQFCVSVYNTVDPTPDWYAVSNICYIGLKLCRIMVIVNQSSDALKGN